jgi:hypothetical protein
MKARFNDLHKIPKLDVHPAFSHLALWKPPYWENP